jgi:outer membrane protein, multidrug efflux system
MFLYQLLSEQSQINRRLALLIILLFTSSSCTLHNVDKNPQTPFTIPKTFANARPSLAQGAAPEPWWRDFQDKTLEGLIQTALARNYDIRKAWTRLVQSKHLLTQSNATLFPEISANTDISRSRSVAQGGAFGDRTFLNTRYNLGLSSSYEVDLWGRAISLQKAAVGDFQASQLDVEATALSIAGQVAETWIRIVEQRSQIELLKRQLITNETFLELTVFRFEQARNTLLDVLQQRQQVASGKTQLPLARSRLAVLQHQLNLLLGRPPAEAIPQGSKLPASPAVPKLGLPAELLTNRPDVKAAQLRLVNADHKVAAKIAERLPTLKVNGNVGYQSFDPATLFSNMVASAGAGLVAPLFDAGRRAAAVDQQRAVVKERLQDFATITLRALKEVEDALAQERFQGRHITQLTVQLELARLALAQAKSRYTQGLVDYLRVLSALQTVQRLEQSKFGASRDKLLFRIQLYRALGGSWTKDLKAPADLAENS